jgi:hypothetical protein
MSQHLTIPVPGKGSIEAVVSCSGRYFDVYDSQGNYIDWAPTEARARAMFEKSEQAEK